MALHLKKKIDMPPNASLARSSPRNSIRPLPLPVPHSPFRIKHGGKFHKRLLAKDRAAPNTGRSSYYCADRRGSVPFHWESRPGTPMDGVAQIAAAGVLPAVVTLPPSYLIRHCYGKVAPDSPRPKRRAKRRISSIFRRLTLRVRCLRAASAKVSLSSSSRWLFSEMGEHHDDHGPEPAVDECSPPRPSPCPWMLPFRFSSCFGNRIVRRMAGR
ncbi:hypothetical protein ACQ4PT_049172 [Festuca glaucescens]